MTRVAAMALLQWANAWEHDPALPWTVDELNRRLSVEGVPREEVPTYLQRPLTDWRHLSQDVRLRLVEEFLTPKRRARIEGPETPPGNRGEG